MLIEIQPHLAVMLQLVLELRQALNDPLTLPLSLRVFRFGSGAVHVVDAASLGTMSLVFSTRLRVYEQ